MIGRRGKPERLAKNVLETIISPVREHSRKLDEIYSRIEAFARGRYLDLFARQRRDGWRPYGDQTSGFDLEGPQEREALVRAASSGGGEVDEARD